MFAGPAKFGIVAYSGVCTHTGCDVTDWFPDVRRFKCPCHESEFDPADGALWLCDSVFEAGGTITWDEHHGDDGLYVLDGELEDARWFTRKELESGFPKLPYRLSIARRLVDDWIERHDHELPARTRA